MYLDPNTARTLEYCANQYTYITEGTKFLNHLGTRYVSGIVGSKKKTYFDFKTRTIIPRPNRNAAAQALRHYQEQLARYPYLEDGFYLSKSVPEDLSPRFW